MNSFPPDWCKGECEYNDCNSTCIHPNLDNAEYRSIMIIGYCPQTHEKVKCGCCGHDIIKVRPLKFYEQKPIDENINFQSLIMMTVCGRMVKAYDHATGAIVNRSDIERKISEFFDEALNNFWSDRRFATIKHKIIHVNKHSPYVKKCIFDLMVSYDWFEPIYNYVVDSNRMERELSNVIEYYMKMPDDVDYSKIKKGE